MLSYLYTFFSFCTMYLMMATTGPKHVQPYINIIIIKKKSCVWLEKLINIMQYNGMDHLTVAFLLLSSSSSRYKIRRRFYNHHQHNHVQFQILSFNLERKASQDISACYKLTVIT
jgi:hypothetical protein